MRVHIEYGELSCMNLWIGEWRCNGCEQIRVTDMHITNASRIWENENKKTDSNRSDVTNESRYL